MNKTIAVVMIAGFASLTAQPAMANEVGEKVFKSKCAMCHALDKKKVGIPVKDMNADDAVLKDVVIHGRKMMPKFGSKLSDEQIAAVVEYLAEHRSANPHLAGH